ncbi:MAG: hypothetical protein HY921_03050 [Elusimicrobia bacterium]|nr:hypothetical protein [Elusimicrobiota bacterium]
MDKSVLPAAESEATEEQIRVMPDRRQGFNASFKSEFTEVSLGKGRGGAGCPVVRMALRAQHAASCIFD